jgi:hypothetical protein
MAIYVPYQQLSIKSSLMGDGGLKNTGFVAF